MNTLYITDLDGTFLNNNAVVSSESTAIINSLVDKGLMFSVATARSLMTARELIKDIKISAPIVLMSGVFIYDLKSNKPVKYFEIDRQLFSDLLGIYDRHDKSPFVFFYGDDDEFEIEFTDLKLPIHKEFYKQRHESFGDLIHKTDEIIYKESKHPLFISLCDEHDDLLPITKEIDKLKGVAYSFYKDTYTKYWFLEVFNGEASKAKGVEIVKEYTKADRVVAFGDNLNDISLFTAANEGYAVSNAVDELKKRATGIILSNEKNGVAKYIEKDFNK